MMATHAINIFQLLKYTAHRIDIAKAYMVAIPANVIEAIKSSFCSFDPNVISLPLWIYVLLLHMSININEIFGIRQDSDRDLDLDFTRDSECDFERDREKTPDRDPDSDVERAFDHDNDFVPVMDSDLASNKDPSKPI